jgi:hypothetical protein
MNKSDFIKWLVKKEREAGILQPRFEKAHRNNEDHWIYYCPEIDKIEDDINLETEGKVIFTYDKDFFTEPKIKEFTYDEFVMLNIDEIYQSIF